MYATGPTRGHSQLCQLYGSVHGMRATIDKAGRLVIPKPLRDQLGLRPGEVELTADGAALRVVPVHDDNLVEVDGRLIVPVSGVTIDDELVRALRDADRR